MGSGLFLCAIQQTCEYLKTYSPLPLVLLVRILNRHRSFSPPSWAVGGWAGSRAQHTQCSSGIKQMPCTMPKLAPSDFQEYSDHGPTHHCFPSSLTYPKHR